MWGGRPRPPGRCSGGWGHPPHIRKDAGRLDSGGQNVKCLPAREAAPLPEEADRFPDGLLVRNPYWNVKIVPLGGISPQ